MSVGTSWVEMLGTSTEGSHLADDRDAVARQVERRADEDAEREREQASRHARRESLGPEQEGECRHAEEEGRAARITEVRQHVGQLGDRVAGAARDAEQLRQLLDGDEDREPEDEGFDDGTRQELRDEPEPQTPRGQEHAADEEHERGGVRQVVVMTDGDVPDGRGEQHRRRRGARHDDVPARAEDRVRGERREERVQACLGRKTGQSRVGDHLGHEQPPHRRAGDGVEAQESPVVIAREPSGHGHEPMQRGRPRRCPCPGIDGGRLGNTPHIDDVVRRTTQARPRRRCSSRS